MFMMRGLGAFFAIFVIGSYTFLRSRRLFCFYGLDCRKKWTYLPRLMAAVLMAGVSFDFLSDSGVLAYYFIGLFLLFDGIAAVVRLSFRKKTKGRLYSLCSGIYESGLAVLLITVLIFAYGRWNMNHIEKTEYTVYTDKQVAPYTIALLTDIHYGTVQDAKLLMAAIEEINAKNPDIVLLGGDIVEEGTSKEEMEEAFRLLGAMRNKFGIYYVYGNHDRQPYTNERTFSDEELAAAIKDSGIVILEDSIVSIQDDLLLAGRGDAGFGRSVSPRLSSEELLGFVDKERYVIVLDHRPVELEENALNGADLQLSGHTHGGQIWPIGLVTELSGSPNYGKYQEGGCTAIVSSGIAGWRYNLRTGHSCEYVLIYLQEE